MGFFKSIKEAIVGKSAKTNEKYVAGLDKSSETFSSR
ncbi:MAG TPA: signal recognition particle-docking protein FtsY, partial [Erysipelotrichaceae bacterium]|nr:signal recognition particle-docking protein FtsY [Erysipelotrichaceae bacterium]HCG96913.1 signal recognition particle-docking protein FtsY [Erysipelotrichaceae bacterium]